MNNPVSWINSAPCGGKRVQHAQTGRKEFIGLLTVKRKKEKKEVRKEARKEKE